MCRLSYVQHRRFISNDRVEKGMFRSYSGSGNSGELYLLLGIGLRPEFLFLPAKSPFGRLCGEVSKIVRRIKRRCKLYFIRFCKNTIKQYYFTKKKMSKLDEYCKMSATIGVATIIQNSC